MAVITLEWFVARVGTDVSLQKPWPREGFATQMTLARFGVCPDMHFESAERCVSFVAELAFERFRCLVVR